MHPPSPSQKYLGHQLPLSLHPYCYHHHPHLHYHHYPHCYHHHHHHHLGFSQLLHLEHSRENPITQVTQDKKSLMYTSVQHTSLLPPGEAKVDRSSEMDKVGKIKLSSPKPSSTSSSSSSSSQSFGESSGKDWLYRYWTPNSSPVYWAGAWWYGRILSPYSFSLRLLTYSE